MSIRMDDLDHSIRISEYDWTSFYEESEECDLLRPSFACPDDCSLSDSEDVGNSSLAFRDGQQETQQSPDLNRVGAESKTEGWTIEGESCRGCKKLVQPNPVGTKIQVGDVTKTAEVDKETRLDIRPDRPAGYTNNTEKVHMKTAEEITQETSDSVTNLLRTEPLNVQSSEESRELTKGEEGRTGSDLKPTRKPDPLSCSQTGLNVKDPHTTERAVFEDVSSVAPRAEKERWFVTVDDSRERQRLRAASVKKKRRQKKLFKGSRRCSLGQENPLEYELQSEINEDKYESEGGGDTQSNHSFVKKSKGLQRIISDSSQMSLTSGEEDDSSEKLAIARLPEENITEPRNKHDPGGPASTARDTFAPSKSESVESDGLDDSAEFLSIHSHDSESYLSAVESVEGPQHPPEDQLMENQQLHRSLPLTSDSHLFELSENTDADCKRDRRMRSRDSTLSSNEAANNCEGYESTSADIFLTRATEKPDDNSTCDNDTHSTMPCMPSDTPEPHKHNINPPASGCSLGDELGPVPDLTVTPCPAAESPETYAHAVGHTPPVYAISAFWDEMEKLTINDILQLRMGRSSPPRGVQETVRPIVEGSPTNPSRPVDTAECGLFDSALMDTSDTADSDYFTQPDESKPDRSSCEFSTSDVEEEYWQFIGTSRNPSPDPHSKNQHGMGDSAFTSHEEESTSSEGKETPVPPEDFAGQCFDDQESHTLTLSELTWPTRMTKSKTLHNVQCLNTEALSLPPLRSDDESGRFLSPSLEDTTVLKVSDTLGTLVPASFLSNTDLLDAHCQISLPVPEVFEYFFTEDKANAESRCVTVYDPDDFSVAPVFDYTFDTFWDETSSFSLQCSEQRPIPIFSCSHPTIRELAFPKPDYVFLSSNSEAVEDFSPIRIVSNSFLQAGQRGPAAAVVAGFRSWNSLLSMRKILFSDKGSIWCRRSGARMFPVEAETISIRKEDPAVMVLSEARVCPASSQFFRELEEQQRILEIIQPTKREGIFSTLKQSDMCLVCIAFASWVLKSSDPETADAWKAVLLANVSALSAIQYLRQYVKKKNPPPQDEP
ncbi:uro-adherence factor A [Brachyistius frenatus]|uniref:uro-adherence factor A n=1 Tax=Brachyistius frenatus TaxID=100188 RepID=UPI0037E7B3AC